LTAKRRKRGIIMTVSTKKTLVLGFTVAFLALVAGNIWALKVTNLQSSDGKTHEVVEDMKAGDLLNTDRAYTIAGVPDKFKDIAWIRTANDSKGTADLEISFDVDESVYVYIVWVDKFVDQMAQFDWLEAYEDSGEDIMIITSPPEQPMSAFKSKEPTGPGTIKTYQGSTHMYFIMLEPAAVSAVESTGKLSTTWAAIRIE